MSRAEEVLQGLRAGRPVAGPLTVHIDVTNGCNAACVTCWDHSPLLTEARPAAWKRQRLDWARFQALTDDLARLGGLRGVVLSGMGEPLTHPDIYRMIAACKARGWHVMMITNLVAADVEALCASGVDQLLVGVQGVTPDSYAAFHPGWTERHFFTMCRYLRRLQRTSVAVRHVQVIDVHTAPELVEMVRFGQSFGADRVNFKLASLARGTEATAITEDQRAWMSREGVPAARALAERLGVATNLDLFEAQLGAGGRATAPIQQVGCAMGYVYSRVTVTGEVLYCCNTAVKVGSLDEAPFSELWYGPRWQALRAHLAAGRYFQGCDQCGKIEQNTKWMGRLRAASGADEALLDALTDDGAPGASA